jgi:DNA-binding MarR family transcriptional regulator
MDDLDRTLGYLMHRIVSSIETAVNRRARKHGLRIEEIRVLFRLFARDRQTVGELANETGIDRTTLSRLLTRMQNRGLLRRLRTAEDHRTVRLSLTKKGEELAQERQPTFRDYESIIVRGISPGEVKAFKATLIRMVANAADVDTEGGIRAVAGRSKKSPLLVESSLSMRSR